MFVRGVAQLGSVEYSVYLGRWFESNRPDSDMLMGYVELHRSHNPLLLLL